MAADTTIANKIQRKQGGEELAVAAGGSITFAAGSAIVGPAEVVTAANVITAAESGTTFYLDLAAGFTSTLPAPELGLRFRFVVKTAPTTAYIINTPTANIIYGNVTTTANEAGVSASAHDTQNFVANEALPGDWTEYHSDGTNWYVSGQVEDAASVTFANV